MIGLHSPRAVLHEMIKAADADKDAPDGGVGVLRAVRAKLLERGLLDMHMTASSLDALIEETLDGIMTAEHAEKRYIEAFDPLT